MVFVVNVEAMHGTNIAVLSPYDFTRFPMKSKRSEAGPIFPRLSELGHSEVWAEVVRAEDVGPIRAQ